MRNVSSRAARVAGLIAIILTFPLYAQQPSLDDLVRTAHFIFIGDVVKLGSTTMPSVAPSANTAVVRVQDVLTLEPMFGAFRGRDITVELRDPQRFEKTLFFTNIAVYGTSLDAIEIAHQSSDGSAEAARSAIRAAEERNLDRAISARMARAEIVASGHVIDVRGVQKRMPDSEHDPMWAVALVKVDAFLKGEGPSTLEVLFPASRDEMWIDSPKFKPGDTGVWLLQRNQQEKGFPKMRLAGLTALDPLDVQPLAALAHLRELLGRQR
jgi:hypothetical protein